jgi:hypothetical protein
MSTANGRAEIAQAFATTRVVTLNGSGVSYYTNTGEPYDRIRDIVNSYTKKLAIYTFNNHRLLYNLNLAKLFGPDGYSSAWLFGLAIILTIPSALIDFISTYITISLVYALYREELSHKSVVHRACAIVVLMFLSIFHYSNIVMGNVWATFFIIVIFIYILLVSFCIWLIKESHGVFFPTIIIVIPLAVALMSQEKTISQVFTDFLSEGMAAAVAVSGIRPIALLLSCTTIFPLLLLASIIVTVTIVCLVVYLVKVAVLGEIYGVVAVTGGTYILGVITTIITCTWFVFSIGHMLSSATASHVEVTRPTTPGFEQLRAPPDAQPDQKSR